MLRVVSGGQTGVDRAALDVALELGLECGGWCPRGRRAEDGAIPAVYPLRETPSQAYGQRTSWNVRDSQATLVLIRGRLRGGSARTVEIAARLGRPCLVVDLAAADAAERVLAFIAATGAHILNVAGPRESNAPGIGDEVAALLRRVLAPRSPSDQGSAIAGT